MKYSALVCLMIASIALRAQTAVKSAIHVLQQAHPEIHWNTSSAQTADIDCDGKPDTVLLGEQGEKVAVGVVWGRDKHPDLFTFPLHSASQDGFCSIPKRIEVVAHDCDSGGGILPGCKAARSCKDFRVMDDDCDAFNFYWDSEHKLLVWGRR
jgi:hypothetical protein